MNKLQCFFSIFFLLVFSQTVHGQDIRMYVFGHSLIDHATDTAATTVPYWIDQISKHANQDYAVGGQFGFLPTHDNLPPSPNWGYHGIEGVWDGDTETFAEADVNTILLTAANFIWDIPAHDPHPGDSETSVVNSTRTIFDWVASQESGVKYYIYGNWPEMNLMNDFPPTPPTSAEILDFHNTTTGPFDQWWLDYQDSMMLHNPETQLIPVGRSIAKLLRDHLDGLIPFDDLYEDSAPHGRASIYFLAAMITYMAVHEENIPADYMPTSIVHETIRDSMAMIRDFFWSELQQFNFPNGESRVFSSTLTSTDNITLEADAIHFYPNPNYGELLISGDFTNYTIEILDAQGNLYDTIENASSSYVLDITGIPNGLYFLQVSNDLHQHLYVRRIVKTE